MYINIIKQTDSECSYVKQNFERIMQSLNPICLDEKNKESDKFFDRAFRHDLEITVQDYVYVYNTEDMDINDVIPKEKYKILISAIISYDYEDIYGKPITYYGYISKGDKSYAYDVLNLKYQIF